MPASPVAEAGAKSRILCVIETIGVGGGAEQLLADLAPVLKENGQDIEIAALFHWPETYAAALEARGVKTHLLDFKRRWAIVHNLGALRALARERGCAMFWGHLYFGNFYACLLALTTRGGKAIVTLHSEGHSQSPPRSLKARGYAWIERWLFGRANAIVAVSSAVKRDYEAFFGWRNVDVVHNGIVASKNPPPPSADERRRLRAELGADDDEFLLVVPARFVAKKGHANFLDALAILKSQKGWVPRVACVGEETPLMATLVDKARGLGLADRVSFSGTIPQARLFARVQAADAVCIPSLREPFGIAGAEAMSLGAALVLSAVDGFLEVVGDSQAALMVPPGDPDALADALWRLYQNPALRAELGARGKVRAEKFDISTCAANWRAVFDRVGRQSA